MTTSLFLLLLIIYSASSAGNPGEGYFINPPEESTPDPSPSFQPVYKVGDILEVSWSTDTDFVDLIVNQLNSPATEIDRPPNAIALTTNSYSWKITTDGSDGGSKFDLAFNNQFNFMLFQVNATAPLATSAFFNISNATVNQYGNIISTSASSSVTRLSTSSSIVPPASSSIDLPTSSSTLSPATTETLPSSKIPSPTSQPTHQGLSATTKVGLGVGIGMASFAGFAMWLLWYFFLRKKRIGQKNSGNLGPRYDGAQQKYEQEKLAQLKYAQENWSPPSELQVRTPSTQTSIRTELP